MSFLQEILKGEYKFEESFPEQDKDFISKLLVPTPEERLGSEQRGNNQLEICNSVNKTVLLGEWEILIFNSLILCLGGIKELKNHEIFASFDWDNISSMTPPKFAPFSADGEVSFLIRCRKSNHNILNS